MMKNRPEQPRGNGPGVRAWRGLLWAPILVTGFLSALPPLVPFSAESARAFKLAQGFISSKPLRMGPVTVSGGPASVGRKWEATFSLEGTWDNPFDPGDVRVDAAIRTPTGSVQNIPGFFYNACVMDGTGRTVPKGDPVWKVRFTPMTPGVHEVILEVSDRTGKSIQQSLFFEAVPAPFQGLVRVSKAVATAFEYGNGKPYLPVGWNLIPPWAPPDQFASNRLPILLAQMQALASAGGNFIRLRADSYYLPLEGVSVEKTGYLGAGWYHQPTAFETDRIYEAAEALGIRVMHCLMEGNAVNSADHPPALRRLHYEFSENGGPCRSREDFFGNPEMRRLVEQRLRYVVARWGFSTALMAWEIFNEINTHRKDGEEIREIVDWHGQIARHLKTLDPWGHLVTTSVHLRGPVEEQGVFRLPEMDFSQIHLYGYVNPAREYPEMAARFQKAFGKPVFFGEYGKQGEKPDPADDPLGIHVHNAQIATALDSGAGVANWFVGMLFAQGHLTHFSNTTGFLMDLPWNDPDLKRLTAEGVRSMAPAGSGRGKTVLLIPRAADPFTKSMREQFTVDPETGEVDGAEFLQKYLHCRAERKTRPTFLLDCGGETVFVATVRRSVGDMDNALVLHLNGKEAGRYPFPAGAGLGLKAWETPQYKQWTVDYAGEVRLPIPPGRHTLTVEAVGKDRLELDMRLEGYGRGADPVAVVGRATDRRAWVWIRNTVNTDGHDRLGIQPMVLDGVTANLRGLTDGRWRLSWRDPWEGRTLPATTATSAGGLCPIQSPPFQRSLFLLLEKI